MFTALAMIGTISERPLEILSLTFSANLGGLFG
jgi:hypothetical protein